MTLLAFLVAIGVLITFHELGHYWVARLCGVKVLRFSIGFGRPLLRWQLGETEWVISPIPLGGYVRMLDERAGIPVAASEQSRAFNRQPVLKRMAIVIAGPAANLLLSVILYAIVLNQGIDLLKPWVGTVTLESPAARVGFQPGDRILTIEGQAMESWREVRLALLDHVSPLDRAVTIEVQTVAGGTVKRVVDVPHYVSRFRQELSAGDIGVAPIRYLPVIGNLDPQGAGAQAGMKSGDKLLAVEGRSITDWQQWVNIIRDSPGKQLTILVERSGKTLDILVRPVSVATEYGFIGRLGATPAIDTGWLESLRFIRHYSPLEAIPLALWKTVDTAWMSMRFIGRMAVGEASMDNLSGPLTIATIAGKTAREGVEAYLEFLALISVGIGVLNLLPIPILDGGQLMYYTAELIKGRPLSERIQLVGQKIGFALLASLMVFALLNDISRLFGG